MVLLNALWVGCINIMGRTIAFREPPASAIYNRGYGYDYSKTDN